MKNTVLHGVAPDARQEVLTLLRNRKMARSPHSYVRGATMRFYDWLAGIDGATIPDGPAIWICGDCHLGNLGPVAHASGEVEIQLRDFDQTVIGNPAHDLIRLGLSLASAARGASLSGRRVSQMLEQLVVGYAGAFTDEGEPGAAPPKPDVVRVVLKSAMARSVEHLRQERTEGQRKQLPIGKRFWPLSEDEHVAIAAICDSEEVRRLVTSLTHRADTAAVRFRDAAYWVKGCSSLGLPRYAALLQVAAHGARTDDFCLLDIKGATRAAAPRQQDAAMPRDNGERVVTGARALSPYLGDRMFATRILGHAAFVRELLPQDLKIDIEALDRQQAGAVARYLAAVVGKAHARQMDAATQRRWSAELKRNYTKSLDAPSWLWRCVVDLLGNHEVGYLEHCRRQTARQATDEARG